MRSSQTREILAYKAAKEIQPWVAGTDTNKDDGFLIMSISGGRCTSYFSKLS